jgi:hypothetical protein
MRTRPRYKIEAILLALGIPLWDGWPRTLNAGVR